MVHVVGVSLRRFIRRQSWTLVVWTLMLGRFMSSQATLDGKSSLFLDVILGWSGKRYLKSSVRASRANTAEAASVIIRNATRIVGRSHKQWRVTLTSLRIQRTNVGTDINTVSWAVMGEGALGRRMRFTENAWTKYLKIVAGKQDNLLNPKWITYQKTEYVNALDINSVCLSKTKTMKRFHWKPSFLGNDQISAKPKK